MLTFTLCLLFKISDPPEAPATPEVSDVTAKSMKVTWKKPKSDGGSQITGYVLEMKEPFSHRWSVVGKTSSTENSFNVTGLQEGNEYEFRVAAENKAGTGEFSKATNPVLAKRPYGELGRMADWQTKPAIREGFLIFIFIV